MDLLYKGAQTHNPTPNGSSADSVEEQETAASLQPLPGQLRLNLQGKLCNEPTKQIVCKEMEPRIQLPTQSSPLKQLRLDARCQLYNGDVGESGKWSSCSNIAATFCVLHKFGSLHSNT